MKDTRLKSGATLGFQIADFEDSMELLETTLREIVGVDIKVDLADAAKLKELVGGDLMQIKDVIFKVIASKPVKTALWKCMESCTYQSASAKAPDRITRATFQSPETRPDYFPVAGEVMMANLAPFFGNLQFSLSSLAGLAEPANPPASKTG